MKKLAIVAFLFMISNLFVSCVDKFAIPSDVNSNGNNDFVVGDTTYLQLNPVWDLSYGLFKPVEISIAQDGRIFVADSGNHSIHVFDQNGNSPAGFDLLKNLMDEDSTMLSPVDVDVDKKMNVFFIDGSNRVFVWNHYWNTVGINRVSIRGTFVNISSGIDSVENVGTDVWYSFLNSSDWELVSTIFEDNTAIIDSLLRPHLFYAGSELDVYPYQTDSSRYTGLTAPADDENMIFLTDGYGGDQSPPQHRIVQINFQRSILVELSTGEIVWAFTGKFGPFVEGYGTGAGTVNQPTSLDVDYQGNLYYTQAGDYFPVHMLVPNFSGDFAAYTSGFQPEADDIMNPSLYSDAVDVAIDNDKNIYVVDQNNADVSVFDSKGRFFKMAGYESSIDTTSIMGKPVAVAVDDRGVVYVCDMDHGSVYRFKLSNSLDEDILPED